MLKIVLGCPGIGKTTLSKKNDLFFDVKPKHFFLENKINLCCLSSETIEYINNLKNVNVLCLDITSVVSIIIKRIKTREFKKIKTKQAKEILEKINKLTDFKDFQDYLYCLKNLNFLSNKKIRVIKIKNENDLLNLENILIDFFTNKT